MGNLKWKVLPGLHFVLCLVCVCSNMYVYLYSDTLLLVLSSLQDQNESPGNALWAHLGWKVMTLSVIVVLSMVVDGQPHTQMQQNVGPVGIEFRVHEKWVGSTSCPATL